MAELLLLTIAQVISKHSSNRFAWSGYALDILECFCRKWALKCRGFKSIKGL